MSRGNNVRGPTSALTEFLKESGITLAQRTVARRGANNRAQPVAGPSNPPNRNQAAEEGEEGREAEDGEQQPSQGQQTRGKRTRRTVNYDSEDLDDAEKEEEPVKKRKLTQAAEAKLKAKAKANAKKMKGKKGQEDDDYEDEEDDAYTAISKSMWTNSAPKPLVGSFETCAKCEQQFTVTRYTMAANPGPGFLCHACAKASGVDPFKKPAAPKPRRAPSDKRNVQSFEEYRFPSLVSMCVQIITKHIDDVEALGDIGSLNMAAISKAISKSRSLTPENALLFYSIEQSELVLHDATNLTSPALETLGHLNPNLTSLRLDFCGHLDDSALASLSASLPQLKRLDLLGPFLVYPATWISFLAAHPSLEAFLLTQSPRFDVDCVQALVDSCGPTLRELRLKEIGQMEDTLLEVLHPLSKFQTLEYLDISDPAKSCTDNGIIDLLAALGSTLTYFNVSGHNLLTNEFLQQGLLVHTGRLERLFLDRLIEVTDQGLADFFNDWLDQNPPLFEVSVARNHLLGDTALFAILKHSARKLEALNINGWGKVEQGGLKCIGAAGKELRRLDVGWCRELDDFMIKAWMGQDPDSPNMGCFKLEELKLWGCNRITSRCPRKQGVSMHGIAI